MGKTVSQKLKAAGIENYLFEARLIEEHAREHNLSAAGLAERRTTREPLQYILGEWEFYGDVYKLDGDCLIPRPETEFLTEYIINHARENALVWDLCSGSGCVSISALKRRRDLRAVLADISGGAVEISRENAVLNGVGGRVEFYCLDITKDASKLRGPPDLIVSNPPYLSESEAARLRAESPELSHEPEAAFIGGTDGLDFYRAIIKNCANICSEIVFECGQNQHEKIAELFGQYGFGCEFIRDYAKIERIVIGKKVILR